MRAAGSEPDTRYPNGPWKISNDCIGMETVAVLKENLCEGVKYACARVIEAGYLAPRAHTISTDTVEV